MAPIIPICNRTRPLAMLRRAMIAGVFAAAAVPSVAAAQDDPAAQAEAKQYFAARLADIDKRDNDALSGYLLLFKGNGDSPALADRLFESAIRNGDMAAALSVVRQPELQNQPGGTGHLVVFADAFRRGDWANAQIAAAQVESKSSYGFIAPMLQSWINIARGNPHGFDSPPGADESLLGYYSTDQQVYFELAAGNLQEARRLLAAFRGVDADFARDLLITAAPIYAAGGDSDFAQGLIGGVASADYLSKAVRSKNNKRGAAGLTPAQGVATLHTRLAGALIEQNAPDQGLIFARVALWLDPQSGAAQRTLARALRALMLDDAAQTAWTAIDRRSPYWPVAIQEQVRHYGGIGQHDTAQKLADAALSQAKNSAYLRLLTAQARENGGDYERAGAIYRQLAEDAEEKAESSVQQAAYLLFYATALDKGGNWSEARRQLEKARLLNPKNPYILNYLGYGLLERGENREQAFDYVKQAYQLAPDSAAITDSLGWGYYLAGEYSRAIFYLERAVQKSGSDAAINEHMGDAYWQAGRRVDARYAWQTARLLAGEPNAARLAQKVDIGLPNYPALKPAGPAPQNP